MKQRIFLKNLCGIIFFLLQMIAHSDAQSASTSIEQPQFVGGECALQKYVEENYPLAERRNGIDGKVLVSLVVEADGQISEAKILEAHYYKAGFKACSKKVKHVPQFEDQEPRLYRQMNHQILKMVYAMPKWQAGKKDGLPVRMPFTLPITYELNAGTMPLMVFMPTSMLLRLPGM